MCMDHVDTAVAPASPMAFLAASRPVSFAEVSGLVPGFRLTFASYAIALCHSHPC